MSQNTSGYSICDNLRFNMALMQMQLAAYHTNIKVTGHHKHFTFVNARQRDQIESLNINIRELDVLIRQTCLPKN
jgi:hypothetical protein